MLVIVNSGGENINSILFALKRLNCDAILTDNPSAIKNADKLILPGVGSANNAMQTLQQKGLISCLKNLTQPVLGICLGMQLLYEDSLEGNTKCLGIIPGKILKIPSLLEFSIPHTGWNSVKIIKKKSKITKNIDNDSFFYFVHSYYAPPSKHSVATTSYSAAITAIVAKDNFYGSQFHPEKSGFIGATILKNFLEL